MVHSKVKPTRPTFTALIRACDGDVQQITQLLIHSRMEITRDDWTRNMLQACFDSHALAFAKFIIEKLRRQRLKPNLTAARAMLSVCLAVGDLDSHVVLQNLLLACGIQLKDVLSSGAIPYPLTHWTLVPILKARKPDSTPSRVSVKCVASNTLSPPLKSPQSVTESDFSSPESSAESHSSRSSSWC